MAIEASHRIDPEELASHLAEFGARVTVSPRGAGSADLVIAVDASESLSMLTYLRDNEATSMRRLVDLTALDRLGRADPSEARFAIVYQLHSPTSGQRLRVEVALASEPEPESESLHGGDAPTIDSVAGLWPAANWLECEAYDLFGIHFRSHPDLRRILLHADFVGAPLRKDHPLKLDPALPEEVEA